MTSEERQQEILAGIRQFKKDFILMHDLVEEVRKTHPDHWLGVYEGEVFIAPDYESFWKMLDERGIPVKDVASIFVARVPRAVVL